MVSQGAREGATSIRLADGAGHPVATGDVVSSPDEEVHASRSMTLRRPDLHRGLEKHRRRWKGWMVSSWRYG